VIVAASLIPWLLCAAGAAVIAAAWAVDRSRRDPRPPERRRHPRVESAEPVLVKRERRMDATYAIDLSLGGVLLAGPDDLEPGEKVTLVIAERERPAIVLRVTPQGYRALVFDG
jgi:PilZ domain-containing protein